MEFVERCNMVRRAAAVGRRVELQDVPYCSLDGERMRDEDALHIVEVAERMAKRKPVVLPTQRVLRAWSNPTPKPKVAKFVTDADIAFAERIVDGDRQRAIALALQFAAGKLKSVRKTYAALFAEA
jgi:hypothetical protein